MESFKVPSDLEISTAYTQGKEAVIALFHRSLGQLAAQLQKLDDQHSNSSQAIVDAFDQPEFNERARSPSQAAKTAGQTGEERRVIHQGDIYWVPVEAPDGLELGVPHPHVVIQDNVINRSRIHSVVVCALTSNRNRANLPGNVLLEAGEGNF